jgi:MFS family permease
MVSAPPAPPPFRVSQRFRYRELLGLVAVQSFGNQMTGSFWIVYLVSPPRSLDFRIATLLWVIAFLTAALGVLLMARGRPIRARTSMTVGLATMAAGHFAFAFLPASWIVVIGGLAFGIYLPLFWLPMNSLLVRETSPANRAGRLAAVTATFMTVAVVAPVLGGYLADAVGFPFLFSLGGLILAANLLRARRLVRLEESFSYVIDLRRMGSRTALAFAGQGGVDGLLSVATPLGAFLLTKDSFALGLLFALFSLAAGIAAVVLGRVSDRVKLRSPFLLLGPALSLPACILASLSLTSLDLGTFAFAVGWLSMTSVVAPSFIYTILVDRMEDSIPAVTATRELILNTSRTVALFAGLIVLAFGGGVSALYLLVGGVILLEVLAK